MSDIKLTARYLTKKRGKKMFLMSLFGTVLKISGVVMLLPCLPCFFYSPNECFSFLSASGAFPAGSSAPVIAFAVFLFSGLFFLTAASSARFAVMCEGMFIPGEDFIPPENMLTLRNGVRFSVFRLLFAAVRLKNCFLFFLPSFIGASVLLYCISSGVAEIPFAVMSASLAVLALAGSFFFRLSGSGMYKGVCTMYLSPMATPLTAVRTAAALKPAEMLGNVFFELSLAPWRLLQAVPFVLPFSFVYVNKCRGLRAMRGSGAKIKCLTEY